MLLQNALKLMGKQKKGRIVNITSVVGVTGNAGQVRITGAHHPWCAKLSCHMHIGL